MQSFRHSLRAGGFKALRLSANTSIRQITAQALQYKARGAELQFVDEPVQVGTPSGDQVLVKFLASSVSHKDFIPVTKR